MRQLSAWGAVLGKDCGGAKRHDAPHQLGGPREHGLGEAMASDLDAQ